MNHQDIIDFIITEKKCQKLTSLELSKKSCIPQSTISRVLKMECAPQMNTLLPILECLGYSFAIMNSKKIGVIK